MSRTTPEHGRVGTDPELDTSGGNPSFRLDLPTAEHLLSPDAVAEHNEAPAEGVIEYRVTRPLTDSMMDNVDIRTFLDHHPVDEERITEVVKNITQYFEPAGWFGAGPLAASGATSDHVVTASDGVVCNCSCDNRYKYRTDMGGEEMEVEEVVDIVLKEGTRICQGMEVHLSLTFITCRLYLQFVAQYFLY